MPTVYYLGRTTKGVAVTRKSAQDYGYTHAVALLNADGELARLPTFSTSADGAWRNARSNHWNVEACELVAMGQVDRAAYEAAKAGERVIGDEEPAAPQADLSVVANTRSILGGTYGTREGWLQAFTEAARPLFVAAGAELPAQVRVSVGFPSKGARSKTIGECWASEASQDGVSEVFIVPGLQADPSRIADVLTHELIHAALGHEEGHGPTFRRVMKRLGLEGKATATVAGDGWRQWAMPVLEALGPFPGAELRSLALAGGKKTQTTRYLKVSCSCCEWTARVTAKHLEGHDSLSCPIPTCDGELGRAE